MIYVVSVGFIFVYLALWRIVQELSELNRNSTHNTQAASEQILLLRGIKALFIESVDKEKL